MSPEEFEELKKLVKDTIHEEVSTIVEAKFASILRKLDDIDEDVNSGFNDVAEDRKDFALMKTNQATIERLMREMVDMTDNQTRRLTRTVEHKADQAIETSAQAVADSVEPIVAGIAKKIVKGIPLNQDKKWWQFWKRRPKNVSEAEPKLDKPEKKDNNKDKKK